MSTPSQDAHDADDAGLTLPAPTEPPFVAGDVRMLTDIGMLALSRHLDRHALALFQAVRALRPAREAGPLGIAMVHLQRGELDAAVALLRTLKPSDTALTFLGIALTRLGETGEARQIFTDIIATAPGSACANIALEMLGSQGTS